MNKLHDLGGQVSVASGYKAYSGTLDKLRVAYASVDPEAIPNAACLKFVGGPAEGAFNAYAAAGVTWAACAKNRSCRQATIKPKIEKSFRKGRTLTADARKAFARVTA